jgi:hypothetical protein
MSAAKKRGRAGNGVSAEAGSSATESQSTSEVIAIDSGGLSVQSIVQAPEVSANDSFKSPPRNMTNDVHADSPVHHSLSPSNRDKFMSKLYVQRVGCYLDSVNVSPTVRLSFRGTVVVLYPPAVNPDRRHIIFMDENGFAGITVWNENVKLFHSGRVGCMVEMSKMALTMHKGQKSLSMTKESQIVFLIDPNVWWTDQLRRPSLSIVDVHSACENTIVSVSGILGFLTVEEKVVRNSLVALLILRIVDRTGEIEVRSWNRKLAEFSHLREKPVMISRARVTAYAGTKMIELIDGASGSVVTDSFDQASDLSAFWKAPADE